MSKSPPRLPEPPPLQPGPREAGAAGPRARVAGRGRVSREFLPAQELQRAPRLSLPPRPLPGM